MKRSKKTLRKTKSRKTNYADRRHALLILSVITCEDDCDFTLPEVSFATCNPEVNESQIEKIYLTKPNADCLTNWEDSAEWATRLSQSSTDAGKIRELTVVGDKPKPETTPKTISGGRIVYGNKKHTINFDIDESNAINHEFVRNAKCIKEVKIWYQTKSGHLFGGNCGIDASFEVDMTLSRTEGDLVLYQGTIKWDSNDLEERIVSPIA